MSFYTLNVLKFDLVLLNFHGPVIDLGISGIPLWKFPEWEMVTSESDLTIIQIK